MCDEHLRRLREKANARRTAERVTWLQNEGYVQIQYVKQCYESGITADQIALQTGMSKHRVYWLLTIGEARKPPPVPKPRKPDLYDRIFAYLAEHPWSCLDQITDGIGHPHKKSVKEILSRAKRMGFLQTRPNPHGVGMIWHLRKIQAPTSPSGVSSRNASPNRPTGSRARRVYFPPTAA